MDHPGVVRHLERFGNLRRHGYGFVDRDRPARDPAREILTLDQFHDQKGQLPAGLVLEPIDRGNMRVVEGGEDVRLTLKSREPIRVAGNRFGQELQRDGTAKLGVFGAIHLAHTTRAKQLDDLVRSHPRA